MPTIIYQIYEHTHTYIILLIGCLNMAPSFLRYHSTYLQL